MPLQMLQSGSPHPLTKIGHVIAIAAGKGGVGKSSVTANLALALKSAGYSVGIIDADLYGPSMRQMLPEKVMPSVKGEIIQPAISFSGIRFISFAFFRKENEAMAVRAPIANGIIAQFIRNVDWGHLDFLFIDFPPGTGDVQLTLIQRANLTGSILVTTPQEVALKDVRKAAHLFEQMNVPIIGIIENMSFFHHLPSDEKIHLFGKGGGERLAMEIGTPFLGGIPIDPAICQCGDQGSSLFSDLENLSPAAKIFSSLAQAIVAHSTNLKQLQKSHLSSVELIWKEMT